MSTDNNNGESLIGFLKNYIDKEKKLSEEKISSRKKIYDELLDEFRLKNNRLKDFEKTNAPEYNVFTILSGILGLETRTHSPFLADLLNFKGEHKQGDLFYRKLLEFLNISDDEFFPANFDLQEIVMEHDTRNGRIDILISYDDSEKRYAIAIENKIYADDQEKQLERYYDYLKSSYVNFKLIYLTPDGHEPEIPGSISRKLFNKLRDENILVLMSYKKDIYNLLDEALLEIKPLVVKSIVSQYKESLKQL